MEKERPQLFSNKDLRNLIIPLVLEQLLVMMVGMADTMMISNAGEAAVSGVSLVDMYNNLIISVLSALSTGGAVVTSQFLGAGKRKDACRSTIQLIVASLFVAAILTALSIVFNHGIISLFFGKVDEAVFSNCVIYLVISAVSYPFLALYNSSAALFRAMNRANVTLRVSILMNIINVCGNAIGIYVFHAGVAGVAIPSLISRLVAAFVLCYLLMDEKNEIHILKEKFKLDFLIIKKIFYIGIPSGIENGIFQLGRVAVVSIIATFGTAQIAANGVANSLDAVGCIGGQAMCLAMITVIGRCVGAGDESQVRYYNKKMLTISYILQAICCGIVIIFINPILKLYGLGEEATYISKVLVLIHNSIGIFMWPLAFIFPNMLRACNDAKYTMTVSIASMILCRIILSLILGVKMGYGAIGVWIAMVADWLVRIVFFLIRYFNGKWRKEAFGNLQHNPC